MGLNAVMIMDSGIRLIMAYSVYNGPVRSLRTSD